MGWIRRIQFNSTQTAVTVGKNNDIAQFLAVADAYLATMLSKPFVAPTDADIIHAVLNIIGHSRQHSILIA